jgi:hypothetical protein
LGHAAKWSDLGGEETFTFFLPCPLENVVMTAGSDPQQQKPSRIGREFEQKKLSGKGCPSQNRNQQIRGKKKRRNEGAKEL